MPFYFFHLRDADDCVLDGEGRELEGLDEVARAALFEARAIIAEDARTGTVPFDKYIDVENAEGELVHRLHFVDSVEIVWPKT